MSVKNRTALLSEITAQITANGNEEITGTILNAILQDLSDSSVNFLGDPAIQGKLGYATILSIVNDGDIPHKKYVDDAIAGATPTGVLLAANNLSDLSDTSTARTNLGLAIGTNVQAYSSNLDSWSAITTSSKLNANGSIAMTGNLDLGGNNAINVNLVKVNDGGGIYNTSNNAHINLEADGHIDFTGTGINANTVPYLDAAKKLLSSDVTPTELGYVSGVTSSIQTQLGAKLTSTLSSARVFVGNGSNIATGVDITGDITISNAGVTAIGASKVTNTMLAGSIAYSKLSLTGAILNADLAGSITASKLVGTDITTVGTIGTGVWQGTSIADTYISSAATWNAKQAALVSGTNIKTVNGTTLLGPGNLAVGDALLAGNNSWTGTNSFSGSITGSGSGSFNIHEIITALTLGASNTFGHLESIAGTLIASANSQTTTGLYVAPTFTNGAFTGIINNLVNFANKFKVNSAGTVNIANFSSAGFVTNDGSGNLASVNSGDVTVDGSGINSIGANKVTYTKSYNGNQLSIVAALKLLSGN